MITYFIASRELRLYYYNPGISMRRIGPSFLLSLFIFSPQARALENVPGGTCAGYPTNAYQWASAPEHLA